jgi:MscS family membrane protein
MNEIILGNKLSNILLCIAILFAGILFKQFLSKLFTRIVYSILKKYSKEVGFEKMLLLLRRPFILFVVLACVYFAFDQLEFPFHKTKFIANPEKLRITYNKFYQVTLTISFTWIVLRLIDFFFMVLKYRALKTSDKYDDQLVPFFKEFTKLFVSISSLFFILSVVFHINITSLVAGIGIGGLAIALAAKESLENLIGSFTIFLDKPFVVGDLIDSAGIKGNVERIGFRSTRIRTLEKSFVTVPNKKLTEGTLDNLTLKTQQRVRYELPLEYNTPASKIKVVVEQVQEVLNTNNLILDDAIVRFYQYSKNGSIDILILFFVKTTDWNLFVDIKQEVNYKILEILENNNVKLFTLNK